MKKYILAFALFCTIEFVHGQTSSITGIVKDPGGSPVNSATVKLNTSQTSITNSRGEFRISGLKPGNYKLTISSVGFQPKEETIILTDGETKSLDLALAVSRESFLNEIIITSRKREQLKEDFTSAVTVVNTKTIQELQTVSNNASDILAAAVPGLGLSSGSSSNWGQNLRGRQVLILVDGVSQSTPLRNGSVDMRTIDPGVIERIEVIKGANSIYGNGAAGGIINYITNSNKNLT
ncbi:MAG: carboxypeptidase regulatory-like domain-containing protein, partial [Daejeonella sp.]|nr:carboxypeptidase regulatory-like domain-containing protein [Daejeonella sp.]